MEKANTPPVFIRVYPCCKPNTGKHGSKKVNMPLMSTIAKTKHG